MTFWRLLFLAAVIYVAFSQGRDWYQQRMQNQTLGQALSKGGAQLASAGIPANCAGKKLCITVFIAPWCGVCQASEPTFHAFYKYLPQNRPDVGFGLVIGAARPEQNAKKQKELAPIESYADDSGSIMKTRQIKAFPTWVVTNDAGKEVFRRAGGLQIFDDSQIPQALALILGR